MDYSSLLLFGSSSSAAAESIPAQGAAAIWWIFSTNTDPIQPEGTTTVTGDLDEGVNAPTWAGTAATNYHLTFDGGDASELRADAVLQQDGDTAMTVAFAANFTHNGPATYVQRATLNSTNVGYQIRVNGQKWEWGVGTPIVAVSPAAAQVQSTALVDDGAWHTWVFTYDGSRNASGLAIYQDGTSIALNTLNDDMGTFTTADTDGWSMGRTSQGIVGTLTVLMQWMGTALDSDQAASVDTYIRTIKSGLFV